MFGVSIDFMQVVVLGLRHRQNGQPKKERPPGRSRGAFWSWLLLRLADELEVISRLLAVAASDELVLDFLTLNEIGDPGPLYGRDMHKGVGSATIRLDESIALGVVEPLHGSCNQGLGLT